MSTMHLMWGSMFVMIVPRRPVSANKGHNAKYAAALQAAAQERNPTIMTGQLYARILWFHKHRTDQDADNIAKRILDSLKGIVYGDDQAVTHCLAARIDATVDYELGDWVSSDPDYENLLQSLADDDRPDLLYIEIGQRTSTTVRFGEVT